MNNTYAYDVKCKNSAYLSISNTCLIFTVENTNKKMLQEVCTLLRKTNEHLSFTYRYSASENFFIGFTVLYYSYQVHFITTIFHIFLNVELLYAPQ